MRKILILSIISASAFGAGLAHAQSDQTPIQLSLVPDVALYPRTTFVEGFSLGIWSENPQSSFTLGLVNGSTGESRGFSWGLANYAETYHGVQWAYFNYTQDEFIGWQHAWVNVDIGNFTGFQDAGVNVVVQDATGLQLGVVNYAGNLRGVQIGLVNVAMNNPWFTEFPDKLATGFPIVNWSF
jgi:hypothetical protein